MANEIFTRLDEPGMIDQKLCTPRQCGKRQTLFHVPGVCGNGIVTLDVRRERKPRREHAQPRKSQRALFP